MIKDRILQFIEYKGIKKNRFEVICGLPQRYVSNIGKTIQSDAIEKIVLNFPDLNLHWLITGNGEMVVEQNQDSKSDNLDDLRKEVEYLKEENSKLLDLVKMYAGAGFEKVRAVG